MNGVQKILLIILLEIMNGHVHREDEFYTTLEMGAANRDLLEFLIDVSHQLEGFLRVQREVDESEAENFHLGAKAIQQHPADSSGSSNDFYPSQTSTANSTALEIPQAGGHSQLSWDYYNHSELQARVAPVSANQVGYATHYYVPSASTNFVNTTQYSAKPSQRQDTGYVYRDETSLPLDHVMPAQEYQPECAYCCWLATTTTHSQPSAASLEPVITIPPTDHFEATNSTVYRIS